MASPAVRLTSIETSTDLSGARSFEVRAVGSSLLTALVSALIESVMPDSHIDVVTTSAEDLRPTDVLLADRDSGRSLVVFGTAPERDDVARHLKAGVFSLIGVDASRSELLLAIDSLVDGPAFVSASIVRSIAIEATTPTSDIRLTAREREIVSLVARGLSNREMAEELCLSFNTVRSHLQAISSKLGVRTRAKLVVRAREVGLI
ncbi:MAG: response regulator transcription factor [Dehalococcoidia bacterium]